MSTLFKYYCFFDSIPEGGRNRGRFLNPVELPNKEPVPKPFELFISLYLKMKHKILKNSDSQKAKKLLHLR